MDQNIWEQIDPQLDVIAEELERLLASPEAETLRAVLAKLSQTVANRYLTELACVVDVFDSGREKPLRLLNIGLGVSESGEVYSTSGDSSVHRYVVDDDIDVLPQDRCPKCLGEWDFKLDQPKCRLCDAQLGVNCWVFLDSDVCPYCEQGTVSSNNPCCDKCGYVVNLNLVKWG
jgi:hypothetical protein